MDSIILFEGTFDPPHIGHERIIKQAINELNAMAVIIPTTTESAIVCSNKPSASPFWMRYDMTLGSLGLIKNTAVIKPFDKLTYTIDNVELVKSLWNPKKLYLLTGSDWKDKLKCFKNSNKLLKLVIPYEGLRNDNISSSMIREKVKKNLDISKYVTPGVRGFINLYNLYR